MIGDLLPFIVSGLATGAIYGLAGTGLVVTYRTSGLFNFGQGAIGAIAAYVFYELVEVHGLDWKLGALVSVVGCGIVLGVAMERFAARVALHSTVMRIVGTIGIFTGVGAYATIRYGTRPRFTDSFLPGANRSVRVFDVNISYEVITVFGIAVACVVGLYAMFRFARIGVEMQAVVDDPQLFAMQASDPQKVRRVAWIIGSTFAALAGVLVAPMLGLDATVLTFLVVQAFGAAALGQMSSIPWTFAGGLAIGVATDVSKKYVLDNPLLQGLPSAIPFIALLTVLLVRPLEKREPAAPNRIRPALQYRAPGRVRLGSGIVVVGVLLLAPTLVGTKLPFLTAGLVTAVMVLSLGLLVRTSGQVSLAHATFAAVGAVTFSQLTTQLSVPWGLAFVVAGLAAVPIGILVALPTVRLSPLYLALATLGFGIMVQRLFYRTSIMFTPFETSRPMPRPSFVTSDNDFYFLVLAIAVAVGVTMVVIHRSRLGRLLNGLAESETAVTSMGLNANVTRLIVFAISAFIAGLAGVLFGCAAGYASGGATVFTPAYSLVLLAMLALAPLAEPWYGLIPAASALIPAYWASENSGDWLNVGFGVFAILVATQGHQPTMPAALRAKLDRLGRRQVPEAPVTARAVPRAEKAKTEGLVVDGLTVRFGGLIAVHDVSFEAAPGQVTGLIGPNGAGKTTTFDAVSGLNRPAAGTVRFDGTDITRLGPAARSRLGIGRTFQRFELCESLSVFDNVSLGAEAGFAGRHPISHIAGSRTQQQEVTDRTNDALIAAGIANLSNHQAGALSTGQRRLVELARCLAGDFRLLLLDEPSSGLGGDETNRFAELLRALAADRGVGVLLVEHDMDLVTSVSDTIHVLDFGKLIATGTPAEVMANDDVRRAYLGEPVEVGR